MDIVLMKSSTFGTITTVIPAASGFHFQLMQASFAVN